ncbi:MAG: SpoIIE family protein phosphatase [Carboxydocellales bacterium]
MNFFQVGAAIAEILAVVLILFLFAEYIKIRKLEAVSRLAYLELNQIIETAADGMRIIDINFNIIRVNESFSHLTALNKSELIGRKCYQVFFGSNCRTPECPLVQILNGAEHYLCDVEKERIDGARVPCIVTATPFRGLNGELLGIAENFKDITERKLVEEALHKSKKEFRESEQTLRAMFRYAAVGIIHADLSGRLLKANKKFHEILGYSRENIRNMKFQDITDPDDMHSDLKQMQSLLAGDISMFSLEQRNYHKDGSIIWVNLTVSLVRDSMNSPKYFIGIIEDISERRRADEILSENNRRINKELKLANSIQASLFPINLPLISGATLAATTLVANEVGGDYCDLFITRKKKLGIAIGDVMGKGIPAALFVAMTYAYVRNFAVETESPSSILNKVNNVLYAPLESNQQFLTLFYAIYDPTSKVLSYANAGHNPPILYCAATGETQTLTVRSFYIGGREQTDYKEGSINLNPGDILLFYTDGLKEGKNPDGEQFGMERIENLIKASYMQDPASIQDIIINEFNDFLLGEPPYDDVTMVIIKINKINRAS